MKANPLRWKSLPGSFDTLNARSLFDSDNQWGIPLIRAALESAVPRWLAPYKARFRSLRELKLDEGAYHFFLPSGRFKCVWERPSEAVKSIRRLPTVLSPAFPLDGPKPQQIMAVYKNRWCGAFWQSQGYIVIPSLSWRGKESYQFAFAGVARGSVVAITARNWQEWPLGFEVMMRSLTPVKVLCFGEEKWEMPEVVSYPERFRLRLVESR